ncbi:MAG: hypothetical protein OSB00_09755 [Sphingomonas bacterium]|nr:hypothetical protein [Sphingomonas bacterium]
MVAPIDAKATLDVDGETFTLTMNFRTIALAEDRRSDVVTSFGQGKPTVSGMALLIWAFARPAHPELTEDEALALALHYGDVTGAALGDLFERASAKGDGSANPPRPTRRKAGSTA